MKEQNFAGGVQHAVADAEAFAAVARILKEAKHPVARGVLFDDLGGVIGRAVVDDEDLQRSIGVGERGLLRGREKCGFWRSRCAAGITML